MERESDSIINKNLIEFTKRVKQYCEEVKKSNDMFNACLIVAGTDIQELGIRESASEIQKHMMNIECASEAIEYMARKNLPLINLPGID